MLNSIVSWALNMRVLLVAAAAALLVPGFVIYGFWTALLGAIIVSLTGIMANWFIGPKGHVEIMVVKR